MVIHKLFGGNGHFQGHGVGGKTSLFFIVICFRAETWQFYWLMWFAGAAPSSWLGTVDQHMSSFGNRGTSCVVSFKYEMELIYCIFKWFYLPVLLSLQILDLTGFLWSTFLFVKFLTINRRWKLVIILFLYFMPEEIMIPTAKKCLTIACLQWAFDKWNVTVFVPLSW